MDESVKRLGRSLAVRHVDAGSCGGCEIALAGARAMRDGLARAGIALVDDPRAADVLLVTGVGTRALADAVRRTLGAMPTPRYVVAVGDCAVDGGVFKGAASALGGVGAIVTVDRVIAGCPPAPVLIVEALMALVDDSAPVSAAPRRRIEPRV